MAREGGGKKTSVGTMEATEGDKMPVETYALFSYQRTKMNSKFNSFSSFCIRIYFGEGNGIKLLEFLSRALMANAPSPS